jgi:hypothetical protein
MHGYSLLIVEVGASIIKREGTRLNKRTMTLNLTEKEMQVLEELCVRKGLNKTALLRQALRLYQTVDRRLERGEKLVFEDERKSEKTELVVL